MTWYRYVSRGGTPTNSHHVYYLPFDNNDRNGDKLAMKEYIWLLQSTIYMPTMMDMIQVKESYMEDIWAPL